MASVLVQDPYHPYAVRFIEILHREHGHRAVCFFTDRRERARYERLFPTLRSAAVEAHFDVEPDRVLEFGQFASARYRIAGVVPHNEPTTLPAARLAARLGREWCPLEVIERFRDKAALKQHLRTKAPHLRINDARIVASVEDVLPRGRPRFERYVLKPNDGWGNRDVACFDERTPASVVAAYLRSARAPTVLESYIEGTEYFVNGHVDASGTAHVVAVFRYSRVHANGRRDIDYETRLVRRSDPAFDVAADYTREVIAASGLVRSPFHVELKIDAEGACLVEANARMAGNGNAFLCDEVHGGAPDLFRIAAQDYVGAPGSRGVSLDWSRYDETSALYVHGIATRSERVHTIVGARDVERLPTFSAWVIRPRIGARVHPTVSSISMPWCVLLVARGPDADRRTTADGDAVRTTLAINPRRSPLRELGAALRAADRRTREEIRSTLVRTSHPRDGSVREERIVWRALRQVADRVDGRLTRAGVLRRGHRDRLPPLLSPSRVELANAVLRWASETIGAPHPELGRKGPICPFVSKTIMVDRLFVAIHDEIDGARPGPLRAVILAHAARLKRELPATDPEGAFNSLVLVFPSIPPERQSVLDRVHDELKAHLMKRDVMSAAFHERSEKPAHHNPAFRAYRAPFACWVLRHMDVRDILFLGHNQEAFERYRQVYAERFERGLVSNEFGYVDLFHQALERFEK